MIIKEEILKEFDDFFPQVIYGRRMSKQLKKFLSDAIDRVEKANQTKLIEFNKRNQQPL